jgi:hypothetical protein
MPLQYRPQRHGSCDEANDQGAIAMMDAEESSMLNVSFCFFQHQRIE